MPWLLPLSMATATFPPPAAPPPAVVALAAVVAGDVDVSSPAGINKADEMDEPVGLVSLVRSVEASAVVTGFALASWRNAENRDGFVWDIARCAVSILTVMLKTCSMSDFLPF